ncbi:hypothetical protein IQ16_02649 [Bradyrhizobium huanghuaihaiense]|uniref:Homing endonuclease LAGLIDADG domain-containing protein n=1 Tax=Bradyrhizobium huanghuaihaiense TaxID=990078 RepID=A0A562RSC4_9BRAD|nr:hypothetical protein [Bradyrhizobium huanghuaihaiense]TWI71975.1 hypothetical protein IQ16_02649 [Bradyrhizobium huanghuaihaiense]
MLLDATQEDIDWFVGTVDNFGSIEIIRKNKNPTLILKFKTPYLDKLLAICDALQYAGSPSGPKKPSGDSVQPQYELVFRGQNLAMIENIVVPRMRTGKREVFAKRRAELHGMRKSLGLNGPQYFIDAAAETAT